jgi:hypothetical protein
MWSWLVACHLLLSAATTFIEIGVYRERYREQANNHTELNLNKITRQIKRFKELYSPFLGFNKYPFFPILFNFLLLSKVGSLCPEWRKSGGGFILE